jgi:hypothetical protein
MRLFRRLRSYFDVVAVPRETERSSRVPRSRNNGDSFRGLFEAAQSTDRTQRYRKPLRARYTRMIALIVELLIRIDRWFNRLSKFSFCFLRFDVYHAVSFSCADRNHVMANILVDATPRFWSVQRRSPCGCTTAASLFHAALRPPRDSSQITFRLHSVRCRTRVHRLAAVFLRVRRSRTLQLSRKLKKRIEDVNKR